MQTQPPELLVASQEEEEPTIIPILMDKSPEKSTLERDRRDLPSLLTIGITGKCFFTLIANCMYVFIKKNLVFVGHFIGI